MQTINNLWSRLKQQPVVFQGLALLLVAWLVLSHAWMTDDAYFSFRSVDNFINGYGLTWNVTERVQGFTHPLWVLLLSGAYAFTHEIYLTSIAISLACTLGLAWLLLRRIGQTAWHGLLGLGLLCLSTAFVDYSTSGLENPLTHLLLAVFLWLFLRQPKQQDHLLALALMAGLAALNRLDTILFYGPALAYLWWRSPKKLAALGSLLLGFLPLIAWEVFSIVYYGFPFPNTYYAKALNYVSAAQEAWAGLNYFYFTLRFDPLTWAVILAGLATAWWSQQARPRLVAAGILLYLAYILQIGGDFMGGRFLSAAYLASTLLLVVYLLPALRPRGRGALLAAAFGLSLLAASPPYFLYARDFATARWQGVVDERMIYAQTNLVRIDALHAFNSQPEHTLLNKAAYLARMLWRGTGFRLEAENDWIELGRELRASAEAQDGVTYLPQGANGFTGFYAGPQVYFIHGLALTDGLLARVPPIYNPNWRSGHFMRRIPEGYLEIEASQITQLPDAALDTYYQAIRRVTHGPLFTPERWQAIWALNTRPFTDWLPEHLTAFRFPKLASATVALQPGQPAEVQLSFAGQGAAAQVNFAERIYTPTLELSTSAGDAFDLYLLGENETELGRVHLAAQPGRGHTVTLPAAVASEGLLAIRLVPVRVYNHAADGEYTLHSLLIPLH